MATFALSLAQSLPRLRQVITSLDVLCTVKTLSTTLKLVTVARAFLKIGLSTFLTLWLGGGDNHHCRRRTEHEFDKMKRKQSAQDSSQSEGESDASGESTVAGIASLVWRPWPDWAAFESWIAL